MKTGRKPVPAILKRLHGFPGHHKKVGVEPEGRANISPPAWFDAEHRAQWEYAIAACALGTSFRHGSGVLAVWVVACVEHARAVHAVRKLGQIVKTKRRQRSPQPVSGIVNRQAISCCVPEPNSDLVLPQEHLLGTISLISAPANDFRPDAKSALDKYLEQKPDRLPT